MRLLAVLFVAATAWVQPVAAMTPPSERITFGPDGPAADARAAAKAGNFGLVWSVGMLGRYPMGIDCNGPIQFAPEEFSIAVQVDSDELPSPCTQLAGACEYEARLGEYGRAYNRTLVDEPNFPFPDVCGPTDPDREWRPWNFKLDQYGTPIRDVEGPPHDLHEAARRGTLAELRRELGRHPVDEVDAFGLTPLAWATIRRRPEIVAALLKAGAKPLPATGDGQWRKPIWLAYRFGCAKCVEILLPTADPEWVKETQPDLFQAAVEGGSTKLVRTVLRSLAPAQSLEKPFETALRGGRTDLRDLMLASRRASAAEDLLRAAGEVGDVASAKLAVANGATGRAGNSPLGEIVLGKREADEELLEVFIAAGADVNETANARGSSARPLRHAVGYAYRAPREPDDMIIAERQRRIILRLLRAGAKAPRRQGEPPLAFIAVVGPHVRGSPHPGAAAAPLPRDILQALIDGGMDINEPADQRTVLDWVLEATPAYPVVDTLKALGARSTATPATAPPTPRTP